MIWLLLILPIGLTLYFLFCFYLLKREVIPNSCLSKYYIEMLPQKFPTVEVIEQYEKQLESEPDNTELRMEIGLTRSFIHQAHGQKNAEHSLWFLENAPLHNYTRFEATGPILMVQQEELKIRAREIWERHIQQSGNNPFYIRAAAESLFSIDSESSLKYWETLLAISPFSQNALHRIARLEKWKLPRGAFAKNPVPEIQKSFEYFKRLMALPGSDCDSIRMEQLRWKYPALFPIWFCTLLLRLLSWMSPSRTIWNDHYRLSEFGMDAFHYGDYELAKKCSKQFLKVQPEAQKSHKYPPIFALGFSLAAMLAFKDNNTEEFSKHLNYRASIPYDGDYQFEMEDSELLTYLALMNKADIAIDFIQRRTNCEHVANQGAQDLIDYIKSGGIPYSEDHYLWRLQLSEKRRNT